MNPRLRYVLLAALTIAVGLSVHLLGTGLDSAVRDITGDVLWASMIVWLVSAAAPTASLATRALIAIGVCYLVETSQLYHAPWIDSIRATLPGHLVLGSGFDRRDLVAYAAGVLLALLIDRLFRRNA
jgi:hypothetical protein